MRQIVGDLSCPEIASEVLQLWMEYEDGSSPEAVVARQLDKLEMIVQADEYERAQKTRLDSFFESTKDSFTHPEVNHFITSESPCTSMIAMYCRCSPGPRS